MKMTFIAILTACSMLVGTTAAWADETPPTSTTTTTVTEVSPSASTEAPAPTVEVVPAPIPVEATGTATLELVPVASPPSVLPAPVADDNKAVVVEDPPVPQRVRGKERIQSKHVFRGGFGMDVGVPSGVGIGFVFNPWIDWARVNISFQENVLSPGVRGSLQLDPFALLPKLPVGLFADFQYGFFPQGTVPGHSADLPSVGYTYESILGGLRLGKPNSFHWNFEFGASHMDISTGNFQSAVAKNGGNFGSLVLGNPSASGWITPSFTTGFCVTWP
jgi:hypothetical protein